LFDPQDQPVSVETSHGHRPSTSTGDRLLISLAVLALLGGGLIGISKILPAEAADATATGAPAQRTARPPSRLVPKRRFAPSPTEVRVES
jgi:hypothetical protein